MTIRDLLTAKAHALAEEMGVTATILHLQAAAHHLTVELRRELDGLIADFRPAGTEVVAPAAVAEAVPAETVEDHAADASQSSEAGPAPGAESADTDAQPAGAA